MSSLNKVLLIGRLGQNPEKKFTASGTSLVRVSLATNEYYTDRNNEKQEKTEWHKLVLWGKNADLAENYLRKGSLVFVEGSLRSNDWVDRDNNKRTTVEVNVSNMRFLDSRRNNDGMMGNEPQNVSNKPKSTPAESPADPEEYIEDDIPF